MERLRMASSVRCLAINLHTTIEWLKGFLLTEKGAGGSAINTPLREFGE